MALGSFSDKSHVFGLIFYEPANVEAVVEFAESRYLWTETGS